MKRLISFVLAIITLVSFSCFGASAKSENKTELLTLENYEQKIIDEVVKDEDIVGKDIEVIPVNDDTSRSSENNMAVKISDDNGAKIVVPYMVVDDELVNSFSYIKNSLNNSRSIDIPINHLSELKLNIYCGYYSKYMYSQGLTAYRLTGMSAYWTSKKSGVRVSNLKVNYDAKGEYWNTNTERKEGNEKYARFFFYRLDVPENTFIYGYEFNSIPYGYGIVCTDQIFHGCVMSFEMNYSINGRNKFDKYSADIFGKAG